jgi:hypothetical protein
MSVFDGLPGFGGHGDGADGRGGSSSQTELEAALDGAALLGLELEPRFRVLAATLEPTAERYPWGAAADRRIQVLCHPVSTILASLQQRGDGATQVLTFDIDHLLDVVASLNGPPLVGPVVGRPEPRPGQWGPRFSMEGRSSAGDGVQRTATFEATADDLHFCLFARFDELEVRDANGRELVPPG